MLDTFRPLLDAARDVDLRDPEGARSALAERLAPGSPEARDLDQRLVALWREGAIANRGEPPVTWSRVAKAGPDTDHHSIDAVWMNGAGPRHTHPGGEIDYCIALEGEPRFDGHPAGWVVYGPGSTHVPTVEGGSMLIVYLLPGGAIEFHREPSEE